MKTERKRSVRTLKEEVQKLDDLYQQKVKVRTLASLFRLAKALS
jgi:hypothetical protein